MFLEIMGAHRVFRLIGKPVEVPYHSPNYKLTPCSMPVENKCPACNKLKELTEQLEGADSVKRSGLKSEIKDLSIEIRFYYNAWVAKLVDPPEDRMYIDPPTSNLADRVFEVLWTDKKLNKSFNPKLTQEWKSAHYDEFYSGWLFNPVDKHPERISFLKGILADPSDMTARLVFADWLDDHDDHNRAEAMRLFVKNNCFNVVDDIDIDDLERFVKLRNKTPELNPFNVWDGLDFTCVSRRGGREDDWKDVYEGNYVPFSSRPIGTIDEIIKGFKMFNINNFLKQGNSKNVEKSMSIRD